MAIEHIRLSQRGKEQLIKLKRYTKIKNWNVLCRWGLMLSLGEPTVPPQHAVPADSSVEMTWRVFGGPHADVYLALLKERCRADGFVLDDETLQKQFRLHLHRGIGYLAGQREIRHIDDLIQLALRTRGPAAQV